MSTVYLGHAVCDENGKAKGGQPGNQTGKELRKQAWYLNEKGWRVFRAKDPQVATKIAQAMKAAVANMNIGYNQSTRNTLYAAASKVGFDPEKVTTPCECDCSSLVRVCCAYAGVRLSDFSTASEASVLLSSGKFVEMIGAQYTESPDYLMAGDILVTKTKGHTAVVLNDGSKGGGGETPSGGKMVLVKGRSVNVRKGNGTAFGILGVAHRGDKYPLLYQATEAPNWYHIEFRGTTGYISSKPAYTELV